MLEENKEEQKSDSKSDSFLEMQREMKSLRKEIASLSRQEIIAISSESSDEELDAGVEGMSEQTEEESVILIKKIYNTMSPPQDD